MPHESQGAWRSAQGWVVGFRTWCIPWEGRAGTTLPAPLPLRCPLSLPTRFSPARALQSHPGDVRSCWLPQEALSRALTSGSLLPLPFLLSGSRGGHAAAWKRAGASLAQVPGGPLRRNLTPSGGPPLWISGGETLMDPVPRGGLQGLGTVWASLSPCPSCARHVTFTRALHPHSSARR